MTVLALEDLVPSVSRETKDRLYAYAALVRKWNPKINLVSKNSLENFWDRHILDSAQLYAIAPELVEKWVDIGSGGGLPAIVLAILAEGENRKTDFLLVESDQRKTAFLRAAARELGLTIRVTPQRIENMAASGADVVSARALAPLDTLLSYAHLHLKSEGIAIFPKGRTSLQEIEKARTLWRFDLGVVPSKTDPDAQILMITGITRD